MRPMDSYAAHVVVALVTRGMPRPKALSLVQGYRRLVIESYKGGVGVEKTASVLQRTQALSPRASTRTGLAAGRAGRAAGVHVGCASVPIEAYLFDGSEDDLPPLLHCRKPTLVEREPGRAAGQTTLWKRDEQASIVERVLGRGVTVKDIEKAHSGITKTGVPANAKIESVYRSVKAAEGVHDFSVVFGLTIGDYSGRMVRRFFRRIETGQVHIYNEIFDLNESIPEGLGRGVGESITANQIRWARGIGVHHIELVAEWVGRYVWATFGFGWGPNEARDKADQLAEYLDDHPDLDATSGSTLRGAFKVPAGSERRAPRIVANSIARDSWMLASLHLAHKNGPMVHVGRTFLAGVRNPANPKRYLAGEEGASGWEGVLVLQPGHPTYERAKVRLKL